MRLVASTMMLEIYEVHAFALPSLHVAVKQRDVNVNLQAMAKLN
jgi:hypothetical protein